MKQNNPIIARLWRGGELESIHRGIWAAVDVDGNVLDTNGDADQLIFPRSATKSFQAMPLLTTGAADAFGFDDGDIAMAMASHSGEVIHVRRVLAILERLGLSEDALQCGPQRPIAPWSDQETRPASMNCSGKHVGFLAVARQLDADPGDYLNPDSPVQRLAFDATVAVTGADPGELSLATDGCSAPTFRMPLRRMAQGIARVANPDSLAEPHASAARRMNAAAATHPELIGGTKGRSDTDLMRATGGRILAKGGAEGVMAIGIHDTGRGYVLKQDDGQTRAIDPLMIELLQRHGFLSEDERAELSTWDDPVLRNSAKLEVGRREIVVESGL